MRRGQRKDSRGGEVRQGEDNGSFLQQEPKHPQPDDWRNMSSALAGRTFVPCRSTATRRVRPGKAFFSGAPVAAKLRSHGVGTRKVTSMNVSIHGLT